jgi:peptide deformylase
MYPNNLQIVHYPHPALTDNNESVTVFDDDLREFCKNMFTLLEQHGGVGLAAPQIAVNKKIFITLYDDKKLIWINPTIQNYEGIMESPEGCLSFPGTHITVLRYKTFTIAYHDEWGKRHHRVMKDDDFLSIIVQHENDHLNGILFFDRV